jgi:hypothetical protein
MLLRPDFLKVYEEKKSYYAYFKNFKLALVFFAGLSIINPQSELALNIYAKIM